MIERGFRIDFPPAALTEVDQAARQAAAPSRAKDLTTWLWSSIDNDETRDLDQIEYAVREKDGIRLFIGVADVISAVVKGSALDAAAYQNSTSVYTGVEVFPMLPERLSTDATSLNEAESRRTYVIEMLVRPTGEIAESMVYPAMTRNHFKLTYHAVAEWLADQGLAERTPNPSSPVTQRVLKVIANAPDLQEQLGLHFEAAQALRARRHANGALSLQTSELRATIKQDGSWELGTHEPTASTRLIENLMIAANQAADRFLAEKNFPTIERMVRTPKRWDRIVELAQARGVTLPPEPDAPALERFLSQQRKADPDQFADLSLAVVKLLGRGEYVGMAADSRQGGHFALAVQQYSHTTAPNRRYPDLVTQRLLHAATSGTSAPYSVADLEAMAAHCTRREDEAQKVERFARKCTAALALTSRIGQTFEGFITGASAKGTWVRLRKPPVEGRLEQFRGRVDVGDRVTVRLIHTDPVRGFIDFELVER
jgi:exoribonuclease-2